MRAAAICIWLISLAPAAAAAQPTLTRPQGRQVITAQTLHAAGIRRLSEIFSLIDDWDVTTTQGFAWDASPRGLASYGRPGWSVMLDGQVVDIALFGVTGLDRLPVTLGQIDSVTVTSMPRLVNGELADAGSLHIHTGRPGGGLAFQAQAQTANATGDPGPFRYTELGTPNIDRIGSGGSGVVSYAGAHAYIEGSALVQEHFVTDPPIRQRNFDITVDGEYPIVKQSAAALAAGFSARGSRHRLYLGHSSTKDYFFLKNYGREVPVESPFTHLGIDGTFRLPSATTLGYRVTYSRNALDKHANALDLDYDWQLDRWHADFEASRRHHSYRARLGVAIESTSAMTSYELSDDGFTLFGFYGELAYPLGSRNDQILSFQLTSSADIAVKAALTHRWRPAPGHTLEAVLAYLERVPEEDGRIGYWIQRGYDFLQDNGVPVSVDGEPVKARNASLDLRWHGQFDRGLRLRLGTYLRALSGLSLEDQPFQYDSESGAFAGPVTLVADRSGEIGGAEIGVDWTEPRGLSLGAYYRYQDVLGGDDATFENAWRTVPTHKLRISAHYTPWRTVDLWAALRYRSSSRWADYGAAEQDSDGAYSATVGETLNLDLGAQKYFWDRRLRLHLMLRDIFNDATPHHPIGPAYGLTLVVQGELLLEELDY